MERDSVPLNEVHHGGVVVKRHFAVLFLLILLIPSLAVSADVYSLSGTVTVNGTPVNEWWVIAGEESGANQGNNAYTDGNGHYQMALFPGTYRCRGGGGLRTNTGEELTRNSAFPSAIREHEISL